MQRATQRCVRSERSYIPDEDKECLDVLHLNIVVLEGKLGNNLVLGKNPIMTAHAFKVQEQRTQF